MSDARNTAAPAISSTWPGRPLGLMWPAFEDGPFLDGSMAMVIEVNASQGATRRAILHSRSFHNERHNPECKIHGVLTAQGHSCRAWRVRCRSRLWPPVQRSRCRSIQARTVAHCCVVRGEAPAADGFGRARAKT